MSVILFTTVIDYSVFHSKLQSINQIISEHLEFFAYFASKRELTIFYSDFYFQKKKISTVFRT